MGPDDITDEELDNYPRCDVDEVLSGEWVERKSPSSVALRRFLAEWIRLFRAEVYPELPRAQRLESHQQIRELHRSHRTEILQAEKRLLESRNKLWSSLWRARSQGGIQ